MTPQTRRIELTDSAILASGFGAASGTAGTLATVPIAWRWSGLPVAAQRGLLAVSLPLAAGFFLFRLFDILKPAPIGWLDRNLGGSWGIVLDDFSAGLCAR